MPTRSQTAGRFLAIEGPNGAGKTGLAAHLADSLGATIIRYPQPFLEFRARSRLDETTPPMSRLIYYLAGVAHMSDEITSTNGPVVCDRYFASPLALMLAEGALSRDDLFEISGPVIERLVIPDVTVLVNAAPEVLRRRLEIRDEQRNGVSMRLTMTSSRFAADWTGHLRQIIADRGPLIEIDTTHLDPHAMRESAEHALADSAVSE